MSTVALNNLWSYLQGLSLSQSDREWLASHLVMPAKTKEPSESQRLDEALSHFHSEWGGEGDALTIARDLRAGLSDTRTVETW